MCPIEENGPRLKEPTPRSKYPLRIGYNGGAAALACRWGVAVAALQDRNGLISLDVPISGDLDNPDFQPGRLFMGILRNAPPP